MKPNRQQCIQFVNICRNLAQQVLHHFRQQTNFSSNARISARVRHSPQRVTSALIFSPYKRWVRLLISG